MKVNVYTRKLRQLKYCLKVLKKLSKDFPQENLIIEKLKLKIKKIIFEIKFCFSRFELKKILLSVGFSVSIGLITNYSNAQHFQPLVQNPNGMEVGDLFVDMDNDGDLDIIRGVAERFYSSSHGSAEYYDGGYFRVYYLNNNVVNGESVFSAPIMISDEGGFGFFNINTADIDNDGDQDLIYHFMGEYYYYYNGTSEIKYKLNQGTPSIPYFGSAGIYSIANIVDLNMGNFLNKPLLKDIDNDGDLDIFSSRIDYLLGVCQMTFIENDGTPSNPAFGSPVPDPFGLPSVTNSEFDLIDLDDDGDLDFITRDPGVSGSLKFYENIGTSSSPLFNTPILNPFGLDINSGQTYLSGTQGQFIDFDYDLDLDFIIPKNSPKGINYYENIGNGAPSFTSVVFNPFCLDPAIGENLVNFYFVGDLEGDNDNDMILCDWNDVYYFENQPNKYYEDADQDGFGSIVNFILSDECTLPNGYVESGTDIDDSNPLISFSPLSTHYEPKISNAFNTQLKDYFFDIDLDGDLDILRVENTVVDYNTTSKIFFLKNNPSQNLPDFDESVLIYDNTIVGYDVVDFNFSVSDIDMDGDLDISFCRNQEWSNGIYPYITDFKYIINVGSVAQPEFGFNQFVNLSSYTDMNDGLGTNFYPGDRTPLLIDIDSDGDEDLFVIDRVSPYNSQIDYQRLLFFRNQGLSPLSFDYQISNPFGLAATGNIIGRYNVDIKFIDIDNDLDQDMLVSSNSQLYFVQNIGNPTTPNFSNPVLNPFGINFNGPLDNGGKPVYVDVDNDSDIDIMTGCASGIKLFVNTGAITLPSFSGATYNPFCIDNLSNVYNIYAGDADLDDDMDLFLTTTDTQSNLEIAYLENTEVGITLYRDNDGDGLGNLNQSVIASGCTTAIVGYVDNSLDCDDSDVNIGVCTQVNVQFCGITVSTLADQLSCQAVSNATNYRYEAFDGVNTLSFTKGSNSVDFRMNKFIGVQYNTTYQVRAAAYINGSWTAYGPYCTISTPKSGVRAIFCGVTLTAMTDNMTTIPVTNATNYKYEAFDGTNTLTFIKGSSVIGFKMSDFENVQYSKTYQVRVSAKVGGIWQSFGSYCEISTPTLTVVNYQFCGITVSTLADQLSCQAVSNATDYRYEAFDGVTTLSFTKGFNSVDFRMNKFIGVQYNTTYQVRVSAYVNGSWTNYGPYCTISTPKSGVRAIFCGVTLTAMTDQLTAIPVTNALNYRYEAFDGTNTLTYIKGTNSTGFKMSDFENILYSKTYQVRVAAKIGSVWQSFGSYCEISTPTLTVVNYQFCGITVSALVDQLSIQAVSNATDYRYEAFDGVTTLSFTKGSNSVDFRMNKFIGVQYNTTYQVRVAAYVNGAWTNYGPYCTISTPKSGVRAIFCGITLTNLTDQLTAIPVTNALNYRYEAFDGTNTLTYIKGSNSTGFKMSDFANVQFCKTYQVRVAAHVTGVWQSFGSYCEIRTPLLTVVNSQFCGTTVGAIGDVLSCQTVPGATNYRYEAFDGVNTLSFVKGSNSVDFKMNSFLGIQYNASYQVRAAAYVNGSWTAYGPSCTISTPKSGVRAIFCNTTVSSMTYQLTAIPVTNATNYKYEAFDGTNTLTFIKGSNNTGFKMSYFPGVQYNRTYQIRVAAFVNGSWKAYGSYCSISTPVARLSEENHSVEETNVVEETNIIDEQQDITLEVFPNPAKGDFTVKSSSEGNYRITNELGQVMRTFELTEANQFEAMIEGLENGVYLIASIEDKIKVVKRVVVMK